MWHILSLFVFENIVKSHHCFFSFLRLYSLIANLSSLSHSALILHRILGVKQVLHCHISQLLGTAVAVDAEHPRHSFPKPRYGFLHSLQRLDSLRLGEHTAIAIGNPACLLAQAFRSSASAERRQHLVRYLVIGLQFRIQLLHFLPKNAVLQFLHRVAPLLGILASQHIAPQMRVFVYRSLRCRHLWVKVYASVLHQAVHLSVRSSQKACMVGYLRIILVEDNVVLCAILTTTTHIVSRIFDANTA